MRHTFVHYVFVLHISFNDGTINIGGKVEARYNLGKVEIRKLELMYVFDVDKAGKSGQIFFIHIHII